MPNWCHNRVTISADTDTLQTIAALFAADQPFNSIQPQPDWGSTPNSDGVLPQPVYCKDPSGVPDTGKISHRIWDDGSADDRWYGWRIANWGTKWDIDSQPISPEVAHGIKDGMLRYDFATAWSPAEGICEALRERFPDADIEWFYDEPAMRFAGYL